MDNTRPGCGADCSREQHRCSPQLYPKAIAYDCFFWQGRTVWQDKRRGYQCHLVSFFSFFHKTKNIVLCGLSLEPVHQFLPKSLIWKGCLKYSKICLGRKEKFRLLQYGSQAKNNTHFHKKGCALGLILRVRGFWNSKVAYYRPGKTQCGVGSSHRGGGGTWVFLGWVCAARDSKLAPRSKK